MVIHAVFQRHDLRSKVRFELGLRRIKGYVAAAAQQVSRIDAQINHYLDNLEIGGNPGMPDWPGDQLLADAHFYFICWDSIAKELKALRENPARLVTPRTVWRKYRTKFEHYQRARDHLEHYSERLPLGKRSTWDYQNDDGRARVSGDPGAVRLGHVFTLNKGKWDVSVSSADPLEVMLGELIEGIRTETDPMFAEWLKGESG